MERGDFLLTAILGGFLVLAIGLLISTTPTLRNTVLTTRNTPKIYYENMEEWEIIKDENGRTKGVRVKRTAKET